MAKDKEIPEVLKLRCMTCWGNQNYDEDAPYQDWDKPCSHLRAIGPDIKRKIAAKSGERKLPGVRKRNKQQLGNDMEGEQEDTLF